MSFVRLCSAWLANRLDMLCSVCLATWFMYSIGRTLHNHGLTLLLSFHRFGSSKEERMFVNSSAKVVVRRIQRDNLFDFVKLGLRRDTDANALWRHLSQFKCTCSQRFCHLHLSHAICIRVGCACRCPLYRQHARIPSPTILAAPTYIGPHMHASNQTVCNWSNQCPDIGKHARPH